MTDLEPNENRQRTQQEHIKNKARTIQEQESRTTSEHGQSNHNARSGKLRRKNNANTEEEQSTHRTMAEQ